MRRTEIRGVGTHTRRAFLKTSSHVAATLSFAGIGLEAAESPGTNELKGKPAVPLEMVKNLPSMVEADGRLRLSFGEEQMVIEGGLQPYLLGTASGALVVQAQTPGKPVPTPRIHYPAVLATVVSRDTGKTWTRLPLKPGENGLNLEGGAVQLRDGTILALDTYITPGKNPGQGLGQLYTSTDDWHILQGPEEVTFDLPKVDFYASKDDGGRPHDAQRLHRSIIELPDGDLLATFYGQLEGDHTPSTYTPAMMKARVMLVRSADRGRHWKSISTVAVDPAVGTEGFCEPVLARISQGAKPGRLLCLLRTGRELYESFSDDEGATWSPARPRVFAGLDIHRTELWVDMFRDLKRNGRFLDENNPDELQGAAVDPDLIELRSGLLVATFGIRIPQKACWPHYEHPWNGNYLAISEDHGESWKNVVRLTSGAPTTHYTAVREALTDNEVFVTYDIGFWGRPQRYTCGRTVKILAKPH